MPADDGAARALPPRHIEPWQVTLGGPRGLALGLELHDALARTEAQARHRVHDHSQPIRTSEIIAPAIWARAIEGPEELGMSRPAKLSLDLATVGSRGGNVPLREKTGVDQDGVTLHVDHRPVPQPVEQLISIGRGQHLGERVVLAALEVTFGQREQVQIVVAEHHDRAISEVAYEAQGRERTRAAIDQISDEPQPVPAPVEAANLEQRPQFVEAALNVAYCVGAQSPPSSCRAPKRCNRMARPNSS